MQENPFGDIPKPSCADETETFFAQLLCRYRTPIVNLAYQLLGDRDEAEDVVQETFVQAFLHLERFRKQAGVFTWLYRIAINACRMRLRKRRPLSLSEIPPPADEGFNEQAWLLKQQVDEVLWQMPEPLREVLILREMHELSYEEIAQVLGSRWRCFACGSMQSTVILAFPYATHNTIS